MTGVDIELDRLRRFWDSRYREFSLPESGWLGAGDLSNALLYRCKTQALRAALKGRRMRADASVLDAGCGQGFFAAFYHREYPAADYTGIDLAEGLVEHLRGRFPGARFDAGDVSSWRAPDGRLFDLIQSLEVLHLFLDDELTRRALTNLASQLAPGGALLLTAVLPEQTLEPNPYIRHLSRPAFRELVAAAGLRLAGERPVYYWMPDGGPSNRYLRFPLARMGPRALYASDRLALALKLPRWFQRGCDSATKLLVLERDHRL